MTYVGERGPELFTPGGPGTVLRITDDTTREELAEALIHLCAEAKAISRRGVVGTCSDDYRRRHEQINAVLGDWLDAAN